MRLVHSGALTIVRTTVEGDLELFGSEERVLRGYADTFLELLRELDLPALAALPPPVPGPGPEDVDDAIRALFPEPSTEPTLCPHDAPWSDCGACPKDEAWCRHRKLPGECDRCERAGGKI